jgi:hypothetical protein
MVRVGESREIQNTSPTSPSRTPTLHNIYGVAGEVGLAYGLGLRDTRAPRDLCRGIPGLLAHGRGIPGPFHIEVYGAGPNRADARRSLKAIMHRLELAPHVWWLLGEAPGTGMSQKFSLFRWRSETVR